MTLTVPSDGTTVMAAVNAGIRTYSTTYVCSTPTCTLSFRILDDGYTDNVGFLTVRIN